LTPLYVAVTLAVSNYADEFMWSVDPGCRILLVGGDPMALTHARAVMRCEPGGGADHPEGAICYLEAEIRDPGAIMAGAREMLDFSQPVEPRRQAAAGRPMRSPATRIRTEAHVR
jgi:S-adenosyl methyltransferase